MKTFKIVFCFLTFNSLNKCFVKSKPNIIIFFADDLGWNDIGFHGSDHLRSPNIDSLAADSIIIDRYYTQPLCTPSRGALLTGIHPIRSGTQNYVLLSGSPWGLPLRHKLLPQYLKDLGYNTHAVGKWHLGFFRKEYIPTNRGFDTHNGYWTSGQDYYSHWNSERGFKGYDFRHNTEVDSNATQLYSTNYLTKKALQIISEHNVCDPLFLYMSYQSVHSANNPFELQAPKELIDKFNYIEDNNRRVFAAMLYSMDLSIGKIVNQLNNKSILNNTIILFLSDNGGAINGFMENSASNYPLRGTKGSLWEGGVRVPAFIWSPLLKNSGYVFDNYVQVIDWIPTILEAIDSKYAKNNYKNFDGTSIWKELNEQNCRQNRELLLNIDPIWNMSSIIVNEWKLIQGSVPKNMSSNPDTWSPTFHINETDPKVKDKINAERKESKVYKVLTKMRRKIDFNLFNETLIVCPNDKNPVKCGLKDFCLFNIRSDPCETHNFAKNYTNIVTNLWQKIVNYNKTAVNPLNKEIDPKANPIYHNNVWDIWIH